MLLFNNLKRLHAELSDEMLAAILGVKLKYLNRPNEIRRQIASRYQFGGVAVQYPTEVGDIEHGDHLYVIRHAKRDWLSESNCDYRGSIVKSTIRFWFISNM